MRDDEQIEHPAVMEPSREPFFDVPGVVVGLVAAIIAVHVGRQLLSPEADDWLVTTLGFIPLRYDVVGITVPGGVVSAVLSPVTHFFVHGDMMHLFINVAMLLAFGGFVARRGTSLQLLAFTALCSAAGALLFYLASSSREATMIGASGGISGLMAAAMRLLFSAVDAAPGRRAGELMRHAAPLIPLQSLRQTLADSRIRLTTGIWFGVNLLAAFGLGTPSEAAIAWEAHLGGYVAGLMLYGAFDPGARYGDSAGQSRGDPGFDGPPEDRPLN